MLLFDGPSLHPYSGTVPTRKPCAILCCASVASDFRSFLPWEAAPGAILDGALESWSPYCFPLINTHLFHVRSSAISYAPPAKKWQPRHHPGCDGRMRDRGTSYSV